jgi:hypothetical protein
VSKAPCTPSGRHSLPMRLGAALENRSLPQIFVVLIFGACQGAGQFVYAEQFDGGP